MDDIEINLGFVKMPVGYKLMKEAYDGLYYWVNEHSEGSKSCDKWWVYRSAKMHSEERRRQA